ncbi:MAG: DUF4097 family beta strand repeat protein [Candidatus Eisenbacteria bacterium]|nr:DUF4097 family beta strand repeat protein [Candidatus Eisenbacteria bacterium]
MRNINRILGTLALSGLAVLVSLAAAAGQTEVDETRSVAADASISISNIAGSVTVRGWDRGEVRITGTLGRDIEGVDVSGDEDRLDIEVDYPENGHDTGDAELEIHVPQACRLDVGTVSADIDVDDLTGRLDLQTVSGDIKARGEPSEITIESVSGGISFLARSEHVRIETVSGDIELDDLEGDLEVQTVSGDVAIRGREFRRLHVGSVSGDINFDGSFVADGRYRFESHSGDVTLILPQATDAEFEINTFSGDIDNDFGQESRRTSKFTPGQELRFSVGNGRADVGIDSFSGDVELRTR